jgi:two-component system phosphate regulon sensor histidine kinase PhoR
MKFKGDRNPSRFALIVFLVLVVFCLGQLTWWVLFQIQRGEKLMQLELDRYTDEIQLIAATVNNSFQEQLNLATAALTYARHDLPEMQYTLERLRKHPAVLGYRIQDSDGDALEWGAVDSTFYAPVGSHGVLYFNQQYIRKLVEDRDAQLTFTVAGTHEGTDGMWVDANMFALSREVVRQLESESRRRIVMFLSEGSFFLLVILFGAFMIYRTLQRSEDLKFRQQHFIQAVTHEFRAPLTSLRLYLEALQKGTVDVQKAQGLYPKMLDDCDRLDGLIDNVLEAGHFGKDGYQLKLSETELANDLDEYLDGLEPLASRLGGRLDRDLERNIVVRTDYQAFGRVIRSLVDNALRYTPPGRRVVKITLRQNQKNAEIRIADQGIGIPPEEQLNIFDRFYRVSDESTRRVHGTGLGLFLVREIIEVHRGRVRVESEGKDRGSVFVVELPVVQQ